MKRADMRAAEAIHVAVFGYFIVLAWTRALPRRRRIKVTAIGAVGLGVNAAAGALVGWLPPLAASVVRDWLPAVLLLVVYWLAGAFFRGSDRRFQNRLAAIDARFAAPLLRWLYRHRVGRSAATVFEAAYLLCYVMVPMGLGAIYLLRLGRFADSFWTVVLSATYLCYAALPFLQSLPPRMLDEKWLDAVPLTAVRRLNLWTLRNASIHANTFPSAHVAASAGTALVMMTLAPWPAGVVFLGVAVCIACGTVAGRYHFGSDAVMGWVVAWAAYGVARWLGKI